MSAGQFKQKYDLIKRDFLSYLQLPDFIRVDLKDRWDLHTGTPVEQLCHADQSLFKTISRVH